MAQAIASHFIPTKILVPVDFSSSSDAALGRTGSELRSLHSAILENRGKR
jgi:hypothetical protein